MYKVYIPILLFVFSHTPELASQVKQFEGSWIKLNTTYLFNFELILKQSENNQVDGYFVWTVINYDEGSELSKNHYKNKLGHTATEYVKGTVDKKSGEYLLKGYKKDDPHNIIGLDTYRLKFDQNGFIHGNTKANNSWLGRIKGKKLISEIL